MSRSIRPLFRLAVPALLVIASIVGGLGPVPGASGQVVATATPAATPAVTVSAMASVSPVATAPVMADVPGTSTPAAVVATTPAMAVASRTATVVVGVPTGETELVTLAAGVSAGTTATATRLASAIATANVGGPEPATGTFTPVASSTPTMASAITPTVAGTPTFGVTWTTTGTDSGIFATPVTQGMSELTSRYSDPSARHGMRPHAVTTPLPTSFASISAGNSHTCALTAAGIAWCWGSNWSGQLGDGSMTGSAVPVMVVTAGGQAFTSVSAGGQHSCGLTVTGDALCWGGNWSGQLGDTTNVNRSVPVRVSGGKTFTGLIAGSDHTCGMATGGLIWCWGGNWYGQLGDGTTGNSNIPVQSGNQAYVQFAAGWAHTCAITLNSQAYCWGRNTSGQLGDQTTSDRSTPVSIYGQHILLNIIASDSHTCGIDIKNDAWCWGSNNSGELGNGTTTPSLKPVLVTGGHRFFGLAAGGSSSQMWAGAHTCGLTTTGSALCWGANRSGEIGNGSTSQVSTPVIIRGGDALSSVVAGNAFTCAVNSRGITFCWGENNSGQLGHGNQVISTEPLRTTAHEPFQSIDVGGNHTCALTRLHQIWCWGLNDSGQLGNGTTEDHANPMIVNSSNIFASVSAGSHHTCALTSDGDALCWGANEYGQLGDGTSINRSNPVSVISTVKFSIIATGQRHSCALTVAGVAWCWGGNSNPPNDYGMIGNGSTASSLIPEKVETSAIFSSITVGDMHSCALTSAGVAYCWGSASNAQLGVSAYGSSLVPAEVISATGLKYSTISAGEGHTCAITDQSKTYCWGGGQFGRLGLPWFNGAIVGGPPEGLWPGYRGDLDMPTQANGLSLGAYHSCAITTSGVPYCWGANQQGQIGDGSTTDRTAPVRAGGTLLYDTISAGGSHTCGITPDGSAWCWGNNYSGQLGTGVMHFSALPIVVAGQVEQSVTGPTPAIGSVRIANVRDTSFTVSWVTDMASTGTIRWGPDDGSAPTNAVYDKRGATGTFTVHFATVSGLAPSTSYRFDVVSGSTTDTNGGVHYLVTTGPTLGATAPDQAFGTVSLRDGSVPASVVVHLTASGPSGTSAALASLVTAAEQKYWAVNLGNLRTSSLDAPFSVTADTVLTVTADCGPDGTAASTSTVAVVRAGTLALTLSDEVSQPMQAGWNLIALRASPATTTTASMVCTALNAVTAGTAVELNRWINGGWDGHRCGLPVNDFTLEPGRGTSCASPGQ